jgi:ABC-type multidrug transport system fused ATPase/permease subunit
MKNKRLVLGLTSIAVILVSLAVMLVDIFAPLNLWTHPVLNLLFCMFVGFGILTLVLAVKSKSPWYFFLSAFLLGLALFYALMQYVKWWIALVVLLLLLIVVAIISVIVAGNKTEDIALNKSAEYKDYKQRREEKIAKEENEQPEELPQIKSFK